MDKKSIHVVCNDNIESLERLLNKDALITGWTSSLKDARLWAKEGGGTEPDIILINAQGYYNAGKFKRGEDPDDSFLIAIREIQNYRSNSILVLVLPEKKAQNTKLIYGFICEGIYNYWFFDTLDQVSINKMINEFRDLEALDDYLENLGEENKKKQQLFTERISSAEAVQDDWFGINSINDTFSDSKDIEFETAENVNQSFDSKKIDWEIISKNINTKIIQRIKKPIKFKPRKIRNEIKPSSIAFWSDDDSVLSYGSGILLALFLADKGYKVALVEGVTRSPKLAAALGIRHPLYNTRRALAGFTKDVESPFKACLFNAKEYKKDVNSFDSHELRNKYPKSLYFMPDDCRLENRVSVYMKNKWKEFLINLAEWCLFDQKFDLLIYVCQGRSFYNKLILEAAQFKMIGLKPWILTSCIKTELGIQRQGDSGYSLITGSNINSVKNYIKGFHNEIFIQAPECFEQDVIEVINSKKSISNLDRESIKYLEQLSKQFFI